MRVEGPAPSLALTHVPTLSHPTALGVRRLRAGADGRREKEARADSCFSFPWRRHLKAREACLPFSEGSDKCNHTV